VYLLAGKKNIENNSADRYISLLTSWHMNMFGFFLTHAGSVRVVLKPFSAYAVRCGLVHCL